MPFEILYFRDADKILRKKKMDKYFFSTMQYLDDALYGMLSKRELLRQALEETDWRKEPLGILDNRRYSYKGLRNQVAIEGSFASYEYILEGMLRLQVGFDNKKIDVGILLLNGQRSEKTPYGSTRELVTEEVKLLYPTINLPLSICLFDLGRPGVYLENNTGEVRNGSERGQDTHAAADGETDKEVPENHRGRPEKETKKKLTGRKEKTVHG